MTFQYMLFTVMVHLGLMPFIAGVESVDNYVHRLNYDPYTQIIEEQATPQCLLGYYHWLNEPMTTQDLEWFHSEESNCVLTTFE